MVGRTFRKVFPVHEGRYSDPRHYHLGVTDDRGRPKLLRRLLREGGIGAVREARRWQSPALAHDVRSKVVIGGAGFVGSNLADALLRDGEDVIVLDNLSRRGVQTNLACREPHLPLELGYAKAILEREGHEVLMLDGLLTGETSHTLADQVAQFGADMTAVTTAPTYLFWRCAPPELRVPAEFLRALGARGGRTVAVSPHGSATPGLTLGKLGVDAVVRGECEEVLADLAGASDWSAVPSTAVTTEGGVQLNGTPAASSFTNHPPLAWPRRVDCPA